MQESYVGDEEEMEAQISGIDTSDCTLQDFSEEYIAALAAIDGALAVDSCGNCCMVGGILHSAHGKENNPARGSRYNSAQAYSDAMKERGKGCMIIVYSEDGSIDVLTTADESNNT